MPIFVACFKVSETCSEISTLLLPACVELLTTEERIVPITIRVAQAV